MANTREIQKSYEKHSGYYEDHQCHVYDLFHKASES